MRIDTTPLQVFVAFGFAVAGGVISALVRLSHKPLCALISLAAGTLFGVTICWHVSGGETAVRPPTPRALMFDTCNH